MFFGMFKEKEVIDDNQNTPDNNNSNDLLDDFGNALDNPSNQDVDLIPLTSFHSSHPEKINYTAYVSQQNVQGQAQQSTTQPSPSEKPANQPNNQYQLNQGLANHKAPNGNVTMPNINTTPDYNINYSQKPSNINQMPNFQNNVKIQPEPMKMNPQVNPMQSPWVPPVGVNNTNQATRQNMPNIQPLNQGYNVNPYINQNNRTSPPKNIYINPNQQYNPMNYKPVQNKPMPNNTQPQFNNAINRPVPQTKQPKDSWDEYINSLNNNINNKQVPLPLNQIPKDVQDSKLNIPQEKKEIQKSDQEKGHIEETIDKKSNVSAKKDLKENELGVKPENDNVTIELPELKSHENDIKQNDQLNEIEIEEPEIEILDIIDDDIVETKESNEPTKEEIQEDSELPDITNNKNNINIDLPTNTKKPSESLDLNIPKEVNDEISENTLPVEITPIYSLQNNVFNPVLEQQQILNPKSIYNETGAIDSYNELLPVEENTKHSIPNNNDSISINSNLIDNKNNIIPNPLENNQENNQTSHSNVPKNSDMVQQVVNMRQSMMPPMYSLQSNIFNPTAPQPVITPQPIILPPQQVFSQTQQSPNIQNTYDEDEDNEISAVNSYNTYVKREIVPVVEEPPEEDQFQLQEQPNVPAGYKVCPKCGQVMRDDYKLCFVCGTSF